MVSSDIRVVQRVDAGLWHGPWLEEDVARQQLSLVYQELGRWIGGESIKPFDVFLEMVGHCEAARPLVILEIGCGVGHYGKLLQLQEQRYVYTGWDVSKAMIDAGKRGFSGVRLVCHDGESGNGPAVYQKSNDLVVLGSVLNHTPDWEAMIENAKRISRKYILIHRIPTAPKTQVTQKLGYGHPMAERQFRVTDLIDAVGVQPMLQTNWGDQASLMFKL